MSPDALSLQRQIEKWRAELDDHENRARALRRMIEGARMIASGQEILASEDLAPAIPVGDGEMNFMGTMSKIVNGSPAPISKSELKETLRKLGFPENQVDGTYFYVAIKKLIGAERVSSQKDKKLWKGTRHD